MERVLIGADGGGTDYRMLEYRTIALDRWGEPIEQLTLPFSEQLELPLVFATRSCDRTETGCDRSVRRDQ